MRQKWTLGLLTATTAAIGCMTHPVVESTNPLLLEIQSTTKRTHQSSDGEELLSDKWSMHFGNSSSQYSDGALDFEISADTSSKYLVEEDSNSERPLWPYPASWTVALCIAYLIVFLIGLVGNLSVLWVIFVLRRNSCHSMFATCNKVFNGLIGNLALADSLVILFCLPPTLIGNIFTPWILGRFVCKAVPYLQGVSVSASIYTLVAISIDRFYGIYYPFNNGFSHIVRRSVIIFIWLFSMFITIPWLLFFDLVSTGQFIMCQEVWPNETLANMYFLIVNLGLQYLLPLLIILFFYVLLFIKIARRKLPAFHSACHRETSTDTVDHWNARIVEQSKIKVLKMLIVIVSLFALSWLPLYVIFVRVRFGKPLDTNSLEGHIVLGITPLAQWLGASNSCVNPILYFFFNAKFRAYLKKAITRNLLCSSSLEFTRNHILNNGNGTAGGGGGVAAVNQTTTKQNNNNTGCLGNYPHKSNGKCNGQPNVNQAKSNHNLMNDVEDEDGSVGSYCCTADSRRKPPKAINGGGGKVPEMIMNNLKKDVEDNCYKINGINATAAATTTAAEDSNNHVKHLNCYHYNSVTFIQLQHKSLLSVKLNRETQV